MAAKSLYRTMDAKTLLDVAMQTINNYNVLGTVLDVATQQRYDEDKKNLIIAHHILSECLERWNELESEATNGD